VMAALCTREGTFKIKKAENTNRMLVVDSQKGEVQTETSVQIEWSPCKTKIYQLT
jgi:hypothetical protein